MSDQAGLLARWASVLIVALGLAYGYGALNTRVAHLEERASDHHALIEGVAELAARLTSLEKEIERVRLALERRPPPR